MNKIDSSRYHSPPSDLYLGPGYNNLPGISNIVFAPYTYFESIKATYAAYKIGDKEGIFQNSLRIINTPLAFIHSLLQANWYVIEGGTLLNLFSSKVSNFLPALARQGSILGIIAALFELFIETHSLNKQISFSNRFLNSKQDPLAAQELLKNIRKKYFEISPKRQEKIHSYVQKHLKNSTVEIQERHKNKIIEQNLLRNKEKLIRRVQPWLVDKIEKELPQLLLDLQSSNTVLRAGAVTQSVAICKDLNTQSQKLIIILIVALSSILLVIVGLSLSLVASLHFLIPFLVVGAGTTLGLLRASLSKGLLAHSGWDLDIHACLPNFVQKMIREMKKKDKKEEVVMVSPKPLFLSFPYKRPVYTPQISYAMRPLNSARTQ